mmetsp:Transcript_26633/g.87119  ORF Transcript_26633/g.87119 Transcript_26633/m.87119 type:complete len:379 (+) Transcript_26633:807-1943(+)
MSRTRSCVTSGSCSAGALGSSGSRQLSRLQLGPPPPPPSSPPPPPPPPPPLTRPKSRAARRGKSGNGPASKALIVRRSGEKERASSMRSSAARGTASPLDTTACTTYPNAARGRPTAVSAAATSTSIARAQARRCQADSSSSGGAGSASWHSEGAALASRRFSTSTPTAPVRTHWRGAAPAEVRSSRITRGSTRGAARRHSLMSRRRCRSSASDSASCGANARSSAASASSVSSVKMRGDASRSRCASIGTPPLCSSSTAISSPPDRAAVSAAITRAAIASAPAADHASAPLSRLRLLCKCFCAAAADADSERVHGTGEGAPPPARSKCRSGRMGSGPPRAVPIRRGRSNVTPPPRANGRHLAGPTSPHAPWLAAAGG